jgi:hypothetical protein
VIGRLVYLVDARVTEHHDPLPPVAAYEAAAIDVLQRYVSGDAPRPATGFDAA